jgi:hypothetical protein
MRSARVVLTCVFVGAVAACGAAGTEPSTLSTATADRPGDLGYFIGYRIAQAYYNKQTDKAAAVRAIIEVFDADAFLAASGYDPR